MNEIERYEFDRQGYLIIRNMLSESQTRDLSAAIDALEDRAEARLSRPADKVSAWGPEYRHDAEHGYYVRGARQTGKTMIIEDFFNADPVFDLLVGHTPTMEYIRAIVQERPTINNSEIRIRYPGNQTSTHWADQSLLNIDTAIPVTASAA